MTLTELVEFYEKNDLDPDRTSLTIRNRAGNLSYVYPTVGSIAFSSMSTQQVVILELD